MPSADSNEGILVRAQLADGHCKRGFLFLYNNQHNIEWIFVLKNIRPWIWAIQSNNTNFFEEEEKITESSSIFITSKFFGHQIAKPVHKFSLVRTLRRLQSPGGKRE